MITNHSWTTIYKISEQWGCDRNSCENHANVCVLSGVGIISMVWLLGNYNRAVYEYEYAEYENKINCQKNIQTMDSALVEQ